MIINRVKNGIRGIFVRNQIEIPFDHDETDARVKALVDMMDLYGVKSVGIESTDKYLYYVTMKIKGTDVSVTGRNTESVVDRINPEIDVHDLRYAAYGVCMMVNREVA